MNSEIKIADYNYALPDDRIAKFPLEHREDSKLLVYRSGAISESRFSQVGTQLPEGSMLVFNNTKVIQARLIFHKSTGARIEIFCLEPHDPADYERAFASREAVQWHCLIGNLKKWKGEVLSIDCQVHNTPCRVTAQRKEPVGDHQIVEFSWDGPCTFGELLEVLGQLPIPPYLGRDTEESDYERYQTVYSKLEGSVAAPTAGLHFTPALIEQLRAEGHPTAEVTLHVGAGTFLPVKSETASEHPMHTEHFEISLTTLEALISGCGKITAVGTTSVRTLESLSVLGYRTLQQGSPYAEQTIGQWEAYSIPNDLDGKTLLTALAKSMKREGISTLKTSTRIMIMPGYRFRIVSSIITNFHQPQSTLLLLVSAFIGTNWKEVYQYALEHQFRFLSYGDSSLLIP